MTGIKRLLCLLLAGLMLSGIVLTAALADDEAEEQEAAVEEKEPEKEEAKEKETEKKESEKKETKEAEPAAVEAKEEKAEVVEAKPEKTSEGSGDSGSSNDKSDSQDSGTSDESGSGESSGQAEDSSPSGDTGNSEDTDRSEDSVNTGTSEDAAEDAAEKDTDNTDAAESFEEADGSDGTSEVGNADEGQEQGQEAEQPTAQDESEGAEGESEEDTEVKLTLAIADPQGLAVSDGAYQVDPAQVAALTLAWKCEGDCDGYEVSVSGGVYSSSTKDTSLALPVAALAAGRYTATVSAIRDDSAVAQAQLVFQIVSAEEPGEAESGDDQPSEEEATDEQQSEEGQPEGEGTEEQQPEEGQPQDQQGDGQRPEGQQPGGQRPGGGRPSGGKSGGASPSGDGAGGEAEQGFHITPGEALTSAHTSGDRDMSPYGSVSLDFDSETAMTSLTLGDAALDIALADGGVFNASLEGDVLTLVPQDDSKAWTLNGYALKTLARSGIQTLYLTMGGATVEFPTEPALTGDVYGALCAAGCVSKDYTYTVSADGVEVSVAGATYRLSKDGSLKEMEVR